MDPLRPAGAEGTPAATPERSESGWRAGQRLLAVVLRGTPPGGGEAQLRIGRETLRARAQMPLVAGERLAIEVSRLTPNITLRVLGTDRPATAPDSPTLTALRALLPRQGGLPQLFAVLMAALARTPQAGAVKADALHQAIERLLNSLLRSTQLGGDAGALRRAILNTGVLFDARTAAGRQTGNDLKGLLLALLRNSAVADGQAPASGTPAEARTPMPPRDGQALSAQPRVPLPQSTAAGADALATAIRDAASGAIARTTLHQMSSADGSQGGTFLLHGELPIRDRDGVDVVHFRIRRNARKAKRQSGEQDWQVGLALDLPALGPLHARIGVHGRSVSTRFWAERATTRESIERELPSLAEALRGCGLEATSLSCQAGTPPAEREPVAPTDTTLLDLHA